MKELTTEYYRDCPHCSKKIKVVIIYGKLYPEASVWVDKEW